MFPRKTRDAIEGFTASNYIFISNLVFTVAILFPPLLAGNPWVWPLPEPASHRGLRYSHSRQTEKSGLLADYWNWECSLITGTGNARWLLILSWDNRHSLCAECGTGMFGMMLRTLKWKKKKIIFLLLLIRLDDISTRFLCAPHKCKPVLFPQLIFNLLPVPTSAYKFNFSS